MIIHRIRRAFGRPAPRLLAVGAVSAGLFAVIAACAMMDATGPLTAPMALDGQNSATPWKRYGGWPQTDWAKFNTLAATNSPAAGAAPRAVATPIRGDAKKGKDLVADRGRGGSCLACHVMGPGSGEMPGNLGPDLSEIGLAGRDDAVLFNQIYDPRVYNPESVMPPWGAHGVFTEDEIKDMVAYLKTLKEPARFKNRLDDPNLRPVPVETRDNLDPLTNEGMTAVEEALDAFAKPGPNGKACAGCHADPKGEFATWAASMPRWSDGLKKFVGVEEFVARHGRETTGAPFPMQSKDNINMAVLLRHLANGAPINVDVTSPQAKDTLAMAEKLIHRKIGQLNFSCVDCHDRGAGKWARGQYLSEFKGAIAHFPTWRTSRLEVWDIRKRLQWCGVAVRANELLPDAPEYDALELFILAQNQGLPLNAPGIRH